MASFGLNRSELFTRRGDSPGVEFPRIQGIECVGVVEEDLSGTYAKALAWKIIANTGFFVLNKPLKEFEKEKLDLLFYADGEKFQFAGGEEGIEANFNGIITKIQRGFLKIIFVMKTLCFAV